MSRTIDPRRVVALGCCLAGMLALCGCTPPAEQSPVSAEDQAPQLQVQDLVAGQGAAAAPGSKVTVHYTGWLYERDAPEQKGKQFDSSRGAGGRPFSFTLGARQVIAGWDEGVNGMRVGGQRRLIIPSALGYGDQGAGGVIPPKATLVFDVELLDVTSTPR